VIMSPITCFSFDETRRYTATDEADLCPVTAIICAIEQFVWTKKISTPTTQFVQRVQLSSEETVQWHKLWQCVIISVFVNHVVIVFWGPNEVDRKRTYIPRLFSEYMLTFRV
jgi:hypothetical protein